MRGVCFIFSTDDTLLQNRISLYVTGEQHQQYLFGLHMGQDNKAKKKMSVILGLTFVLGAQKNHLIEHQLRQTDKDISSTVAC